MSVVQRIERILRPQLPFPPLHFYQVVVAVAEAAPPALHTAPAIPISVTGPPDLKVWLSAAAPHSLSLSLPRCPRYGITMDRPQTGRTNGQEFK